jgi:hypothetical protein
MSVPEQLDGKRRKIKTVNIFKINESKSEEHSEITNYHLIYYLLFSQPN